ncbi:MBL fold metallo-hydrolase [Siccirubricoccus sp. KC 17139]|uniref:MBL fold metallo-hydrolase n=1 Tax=Siccirubricoccus soli TaxID=2899147 RepID=A0ABT1D3Z9_9PROT|nr:MBL fold metallo-hydrolase [Siccirubricoccus soli]MCO6415934.1 MBL fold metallo-hydrolase [Siccirubricoccus soli]MCP2682066.1 MBL fold metallo-hydrolase [Siccirubricoccus soli]
MPDLPPTLAPEAPPPGEVREVQPGLLRVRMPLPFPPGHVNIWLLEHAGGWLAVDTAIASRTTRELWTQVLAQKALGGRPLTALLITHFHPDHIGLAGWLCERFGIFPHITRIEWLMARALWYDSGPDMMAQQIAHYTSAGCPAEYLSFVESRGPLYQRNVAELPRSFHALKDGRAIAIGGSEWQVVTGAGHAPDMATLYSPERKVLISADQILPRISPYIGLHPGEPEADPLGDFLASNERFRPLPEDTLVLPSHGEPFATLHRRLDTLAGHHAERLDTLAEACREPLTAFEAAQILFPRAAGEMTQIGFTVGETLAHLRRLERQGRLTVEKGEVWRFRTR